MTRIPDSSNLRERILYRNGKREIHYQVRLQVRDPITGKLRKFVQTFDNKEDARRWRDITRGQGQLGDIGERDELSKAIQTVTLEQALIRFRAEVLLRKLTRRRAAMGSDEVGMTTLFMKREASRLCRKLVVDLMPIDFRNYLERRLTEGVLVTTIQRELNPIRVMFKHAAKYWQYPPKRYLFEGLFNDYKDELNTSRDRTLQPYERFRLYKAIEQIKDRKRRRMWLTFLVTATTAGLRRGELLGLEWRDVDLYDPNPGVGDNTITVRKEIAKNRKVRLLPLSSRTVKEFVWYRDELNDDEVNAQAKVFPITPSGVEQAWRRICKKAGIDHRDLHIHDLRHTAMTNWVQAPIRLSEPELNWMLKGKLFNDKVLSIYANPKVRDIVADIRARLETAEDIFDEAHVNGAAGKRQDLTVEEIASLRQLLSPQREWLDQWDWIEKDGQVIIDKDGPKTQKALAMLGQMPFGGDEVLEGHWKKTFGR